MKQRILVAEDDQNIRAALAELLTEEGYDVVQAADGLHAKDVFDRQAPDIACLDVMMPGMSGFDLCKHFRAASPTMPILFITAKAEEIDKVVGLELGGDDYIVKPFGTKEVIARIRAVARRCLRESASQDHEAFSLEPFAMGELTIMPRKLRVQRDDDGITVTRREMLILQTLAARPGEVVTRADLFRTAWEDDHLPNSRTLDQTISQLRKRIEIDPKHPEIIQTVYGVGYRYDP